jgi:hypothetical protein
VTKRGKQRIWVAFGVLLMLGAMVIALLPARSEPLAAQGSACDPKACVPPRCAPGFHPELAPGACCAACRPDPLVSPPSRPDACAHQRCEPCPVGTREKPAPGEFCPTCVAIDRDACATGLAHYEARWSALESELRSCSADDDCMSASFTDACRATCPLPLNKQRLGSVASQLQEEAAVHCEQCQPPSFQCPELSPSTKVVCVKGRCEYRTP